MDEETSDRMLEAQPMTPANDDLARALDWIGLSAALGMVIAAAAIAFGA